MHKMHKILEILIASMLSLVAILETLVARMEEGNPTQEDGELLDWADKIINSDIFVVFLIGLAAAVIIMMFLDLRRETKQYMFKAQSKRFYNFFVKWYSRPGKLSIICDDLDWIESPKDKRLVEILEKKASEDNLELFLGRREKTALITTLKEKGAKVRKAPGGIISQYSFSCLSVMGNNSSVIVRNKQADAGHTIKFEEISNTYVSELLNTLLTRR